MQGTHTLAALSQMGLSAVPQLVSSVQTTHLQTGVAPEQSVLALHWAQLPSIRHAGAAAFFALHWPSDPHPVHWFLVLSQIGFAVVVHWVSSTQATHVLVV
jgi:hypothetical protein